MNSLVLLFLGYLTTKSLTINLNTFWHYSDFKEGFNSYNIWWTPCTFWS